MERYIPDRWGGGRSRRTGGASGWVRASLEPRRSVRARRQPQVCGSFLPSAPRLRHPAVCPYSAQVAEPVDLQHPHWARSSGAAEPQGHGARRRLPAAGGRARGFVSATRTPGDSNLSDGAGDKKSIESGRDDNELRIRRFSSLPLGRCESTPARSRRNTLHMGWGRERGGVSPGRSESEILTCFSSPGEEEQR